MFRRTLASGGRAPAIWLLACHHACHLLSWIGRVAEFIFKLAVVIARSVYGMQPLGFGEGLFLTRVQSAGLGGRFRLREMPTLLPGIILPLFGLPF